jgi:hypothetical protein
LSARASDHFLALQNGIDQYINDIYCARLSKPPSTASPVANKSERRSLPRQARHFGTSGSAHCPERTLGARARGYA